MKNSMMGPILTLASLNCFGQGTVDFANIGPGLNAPVVAASVSRLSGPHYQAGLLGGPTPTSLTLLATTAFRTGAHAGYFSGGQVAIPGVPGGSTAWVQIVAWDTTLEGTTNNATYAQALVSGLLVWGGSSVFSVATGNPDSSPPGVPAPLVGLGGFNVGCLQPYFGPNFVVPTNQTVAVGNTVSFSVRAAACPCPNYQWYFNGAIIPGATDNDYQIANVELTNAGNYSVILSDSSWGSFTNSADLTVQGAPAIMFQPESQTAFEGATASFHVTVVGPAPSAYQWLFDGNVFAGATSGALQLTDVNTAQAGAYTVLVRNDFGTVTSAPAMLSVTPPVDRRLLPGLAYTGQPGTTANLDAADALGPSPNWAALDTLVLSNGPRWYFDPSFPRPTRRFYRAWQAATLGLPPALEIHIIPALTLTGSIGSTIRVDAINQFGPTDAWFPLATVTLTNTSQLYFDTSAVGQPSRLWRLVPVP